MSGLTRREFLGAMGAAAASAVTARALAADGGGQRPDILVIVADDLGWGHVGFQGSAIPTPNLDALARGGVTLQQHYVAPVCSPTRAALLSGRYWSRFGVTNPANERVFPWDTLTLAGALKSAGYTTAISGKWHLGSKPEWGPRKFGFEHSYGSLPGGLGPYTHLYRAGPYQRCWHRNDQFIDEEGHVTDLFTAEAVRRVEEAGKNPLFLYVPYTAPHFPISEPQEWMDRTAHIKDPALRLYGAAIAHMDAGIGRIIAALEKAGRRENTLILFFGDNGASGQNNHGNYPGEYQKLTLPGSNAPLRAKKGSVYEGGIRTPAFIHWAGALKPGKLDTPLHVVDWTPTLCGLAGYKPARDPKWDGQDILPVIRGDAKPAPRTLYWKGGPNAFALRRGNLKLVAQGKKPAELYDIPADMGEKNDLAPARPEVVAELQGMLKAEQAKDDDAVVRE